MYPTELVKPLLPLSQLCIFMTKIHMQIKSILQLSWFRWLWCGSDMVVEHYWWLSYQMKHCSLFCSLLQVFNVLGWIIKHFVQQWPFPGYYDSNLLCNSCITLLVCLFFITDFYTALLTLSGCCCFVKAAGISQMVIVRQICPMDTCSGPMMSHLTLAALILWKGLLGSK